MINQSSEILRMIETVDPSDTAKLDEIDARVQAYIMGVPFIALDSSNKRNYIWGRNDIEFGSVHIEYKYTRSRDVLKAIRPKGASVTVYAECGLGDLISVCEVSLSDSLEWKSPQLPTEELAELHAIIQAIEYERSSND